jgi:hypothetical protein
LYRFKNIIKRIAKNKEYNDDNLVISKSKNISKDIGSSNSIFGMKSFGLFIALKVKKNVYSFQKNKFIFTKYI